MHGSTSDEGPSTVESGPSAQPQYSHNYPPPNGPPGVIQPNVPAYGPPLSGPQYQYPPPPPAPFAAQAYRPPAPFSFYEAGTGTASAPRQRTSIACRYCRKRKIRCSGKDNTPDGKCQNCTRMNQECIFSGIESASAFVPAPFAPGFVPPGNFTYGPFGEPSVQAQHQNVDVSISDYGASPNLTHNYYPQHRTSGPPPPDHRGDYRGGYRGRSFQGITSSLSDRRARDRNDLNDETLLDAESVVPINSETTVDDYDVSETWNSHSSKHPEKTVQTVPDKLQALLTIPILPLPQGLEPQSPAASPEVLQDHDWKHTNLKELKVRVAKLAESAKEPIKLPDPARLRISSSTPSSSPTVSSDRDVDSISADSEVSSMPVLESGFEKYWDCFLKKNDTIAHLKDFDLFDSHALERSCTRGPSANLEGISQQQKNQLSLKSKGSVEQQWYTVWSIFFPDMEPPATIHIYTTQSEDFCRIQEFAQREGVAIMLDELETNGLVVRPDASNQLLRSAVQRAMVLILRSYSVRGEPSSEADEPILSQALEPDNGVSLQQESTTEGPTGHGNHPSSSIDTEQKYRVTISNHDFMAS
ncbi:Zn(2)-C6 fungal-type DNA-binding domain containing protein [Fusarium agapanthi]|uniref:Zn(2)-C6 fungal-type DNA-binding domain containing protein n=1 Tax=Fusarium agapanthi TaxID=1803897 RepID=A0A9P5E7X0_9HYPO|nr:Zn(2)-C6 fungal-type DNA-binding domain containing protein [Fusarium agapanthi]